SHREAATGPSLASGALWAWRHRSAAARLSRRGGTCSPGSGGGSASLPAVNPSGRTSPRPRPTAYQSLPAELATASQRRVPMRISGEAVIVGLALVVIVPSAAQAPPLADTRAPVPRQTSLGRDVDMPFLEFSEGGTLTFQSTHLMVWSDGKAFVSTSGRAGREV